MKPKYCLWFVETSTISGVDSYLWTSEDEESSCWGVKTEYLDERLVDAVSLFDQISYYPTDIFTPIHFGTAEECVSVAKTLSLLGIGKSEELVHV